MSGKNARMGQLADMLAVELNQPPARQQEESQEEKPKRTKAVLIKNKPIQSTPEQSLDKIQLNPPHGEKDGFERMSITLPPEIRQRLLDESNRRKKERSPDWSISVIVREALAAHLK